MSDCPFLADSTIHDPRFFVGRREALKLLSDRMQGSQPTSINVVGHHKTGKSSLLVHFQQTYGQRVANSENFRVIYLSLQDSACQTEASFYREITKEIEKGDAIPAGGVVAELLSRFKQGNSAGQTQTGFDRLGFTEFVKGFKDKGILPVLCVDNFEELLERREQFPNGFYDNLRSLIDSNCLMMVMASRQMLDVYSREKQITSDFFNVFQTIDLNGGLTDEAATELVKKKNGTGEGLTADLQGMALRWGKREPFLLQLAARTLWDMQRYGRLQKWAKTEFKKQANRFKFQPQSKLFRYCYQVFRKIGQACFLFMSKKDEAKEVVIGVIVFSLIIITLLLFGLGWIPWDKFQALIDYFLGG